MIYIIGSYLTRHYVPTHFVGQLNSNWLDYTIGLLLRSQSADLQCFVDFKNAAKPIITGGA